MPEHVELGTAVDRSPHMMRGGALLRHDMSVFDNPSVFVRLLSVRQL